MKQTTAENFLEHNAGFILSSCLFLAVFSFMIAKHIPKIIDDMKKISVEINLTNVKTLPAVAPSNTIPEPEPVRRILPQSESDETNKEAMEVNKESQRADIESLKSANSSSAEIIRFSPITAEEILNQRTKLDKEKAGLKSERQNINDWLEKQGLSFNAKNFMMPSDGKAKGVIRVLDLKDFPKEIVDYILRKYHIKIVTRYIKQTSESSFLNQAELGDDEIFYNMRGEGVFEVFELSPFAITKMTVLEIEEMKKRNLSQHKTRVREIHFCIIKNNDNDYDIGVKKFVYDVIP